MNRAELALFFYVAFKPCALGVDSGKCRSRMEKETGLGRSLFVYGNIKMRKSPAYMFKKGLEKVLELRKKTLLSRKILLVLQ